MSYESCTYPKVFVPEGQLYPKVFDAMNNLVMKKSIMKTNS